MGPEKKTKIVVTISDKRCEPEFLAELANTLQERCIRSAMLFEK